MKIPLGQLQTMWGDPNPKLDGTVHTHVIGETGCGKSTLLLNLFSAYVRAGYGIALNDPNGDMAAMAMDLVPKGRLRDTVVVNPLAERVVGFNPLEGKNPELRVENALGILAHFYGTNSWLARADYISRNLALAVVKTIRNATLFHITRALVDDEYRAYVSKRSPSDFHLFFKAYDEKWPAKERETAAASPLNKFDLLNKPNIRAILGQSSGLNLREVLDRRKILFLSFPKGLLGEETTALLSAIFTAGITHAALERADTKFRPPFAFIMDEAQNNFRTNAVITLLTESRKYGITLIAAFQTTTQIEPDMLSILLGNTPNKLYYAVSAEDAQKLSPELGLANPKMLVGLGRGYCYARLTRDGRKSSPLLIKTNPAPHLFGDETTRDAVIRWSLSNHGTPRGIVDRGVNRILKGGS
jgi:DNA helicase HerA-like ATPase